MIDYDETIIHKFAAGLYQQAIVVLVAYPIAFFGVAWLLASYVLPRGSSVAIVVAAVAAGVGYLMASSRAQQLRLIAQTALCQARIEQNTRRTTAPASNQG